jgi:hypothetical protein
MVEAPKKQEEDASTGEPVLELADLRKQYRQLLERHVAQEADLKRALLVLADQRAESAQGVSTRSESIGDLNTFLFKELPYRNVVASNLTQGLVEVEDMRNMVDSPPIRWQLPYWSFGSKYYRIDRAVRVNYSYAYPQPGEPPLQGSLFFGFQSNGKVALTSERNATARIAAALARPMIRETQMAIEATAPKGDNHRLTFDSRLPKLDALLDSLRTGTNPGVNTTHFSNIIHDFDDFVVSMEPNGPGRLPTTISDWARQFVPKRRFEFGDTVTYCGIAADNNQTQPFMYNLAELVAANKLDDLIAWHFSSTAFRVTKAIRLTYSYEWRPVMDSNANQILEGEGKTSGTLLIGYTGPHPS